MVLPRLRASLAFPMYRSGYQGHGPWLHGDSPLERGTAMSRAPHSTHHPLASSGTRAPGRGKLRTSAQRGWEHEGFPMGTEGGTDPHLHRSHPGSQPGDPEQPPPHPARHRRDAQWGPFFCLPPPTAGSCRPAKERPRVPGAGVAVLPGWEQDGALPRVQRAARGGDTVLFTR